jgi:DNA-binding NarL/FixJ family response regulator
MPLVGREDERAVLGRWLDEAVAGRDARAFVLLGEAGIGKTALWQDTVHRAEVHGARVLAAAPAEAEAGLTFAALGDLFADVEPQHLDALGRPQRTALEASLLRRPVAGPPPDERAVGLAVAALLGALATTGPVLLAVDDVPWLDPASAAALAFAVRRLSAERVLALLTARTADAVPPALRAALGPCRRLDLGPLSLGATQQLLRSDAHGLVSHGAARRIHETAQGNPLHALELLRADRPDESLPGAAAFRPPRELADLVRERLARLPASTRELLLAVSALSRPTLDDLAALAGHDPVSDVASAVESGLLVVDGARLRFAHPLFAAACYRGVSLAARRDMHSRLAALVTDPEERARHQASAAEAPDDRTAGALDLAARQARARGAVDAAAELMLLAGEHTEDRAGEQAGRRARDAARHLTDAGRPERAREVLVAARARCTEASERVRLTLALATVVYELDGPGPSLCLTREAMAATGADADLQAEAHLSYVEHSHAPVQERLAHITAGLRLVEARSDANPVVHARLLREAALARYHAGEGMPRDLMQQATEIEARCPEPVPVAWRARTCLGECLKYLDEFAESERLLAESAALAEQTGDVVSLVGTLGHQSELALWLGQWDTADACAERALALADELDQQSRKPFALMGRLLVAAHRGQVDTARTLGADALATARVAGDGWAEALVLAAIGFTELAAGQPAAAVEALDRTDRFMSEALRTEPRQWRYLVDHVAALTLVGDLPRALEQLRRLDDWAGRMGTGWPRLMAARARGVVLGQQGDAEAALAALEEAVAIGETLPLPFVRARGQLTLGIALRRVRSRRRARELLDEAIAAFDDLGAWGYAEQARAEVGRISGRAGSGGALTATEERVAALVAQGLSNKEVARQLVVTPRTVEAHLTRIYSKLGLRSRAELARQSVGVSAVSPDPGRS